MDTRQTKIIEAIIPAEELPKTQAILTAMSQRDLQLFSLLLRDLSEYQLLDKDLVLLVLISLTMKLPKVAISPVSKVGDGLCKTILKELCLYRKPNQPSTYLLDGQPLYQMDIHHPAFESYSGAHAKVKKGFLTKGNSTNFFAIKKIKFNSLLPNVDRLVEHEAKYARFLGRNAVIFERNKHFRVVLDWMEGVALADVEEETLKAAPLATLLTCLRHLFSQVLQLHAIYHIVGDIKPENCVLNLTNQQLFLIDLDGAHKVGSKKNYPWTKAYADTQEGSLHYFASDVYMLGHVVQRLLPWVSCLEDYQGTANDAMRLAGIQSLITAMLAANPKERCTVYHADQFCELLLNPVNNLDSELLEYYLTETINCRRMRVEDVMGLTSRPILI